MEKTLATREVRPGSLFGDWNNSRMRPKRCRAAGRGAHHELRFNRDLSNVIRGSLDLIDQRFGRDLAHALQWLTHRGQARAVKSGSRNVVESHHAHIFRNAQSSFA